MKMCVHSVVLPGMACISRRFNNSMLIKLTLLRSRNCERRYSVVN